ncbi:Phenylalanyl-tRNA synthetase, beta subunit, cytoplasmic [Hypoxylon texense]
MGRSKSRRKRKQRRSLAVVKEESVEFEFDRVQYRARPGRIRAPARDTSVPARAKAKSSNYGDTRRENTRSSVRNFMLATPGSQREKSNHTGSKPSFGCPGPRDSRFEKLVWAPQPVPAVPAERALEDVLREHPEVKFEGIDKSALSFTAKAVLQVANEATWGWLHRWCPDVFASIASIASEIRTDHGATVNPPIVPAEAMDFRGIDAPLAKLYCNCLAAGAECPVVRPVDVVATIDNCIIFCLVIKDEKRVNPLRVLKDMVQWIPIGLGCKMLDVQKKASQEISRNARTALNISKREEGMILDKAMRTYEKHRLGFKAQLLDQVKVLLDATAPIDIHERMTSPPTPLLLREDAFDNMVEVVELSD